MKKIVKTFLIVFMIVLLVFPKALAVEISDMINGDNTKSDSTDAEQNAPEETEENVESNTPEAMEEDVESNVPETTEKDVDLNAPETRTDVGENTIDINGDNELDDLELVQEDTNVYAEISTYSLTNSITTGMQKIEDTWRMLENGKINYTYKGLGINEYGTWYFENGKINFNYTGTYRDEAGNTWVITEGKVETEVELAKVNSIWRKVDNGKINYTYTGVGTNAYGTWYFENGVINSNFTDTYDDGEKAYIVEEGKVYETVASNMTGMLKVNNTIWRMLENGKVNYTYTGLGTNSFGTWYFKNGEIKTDFTGIYKDKNEDIWAVTEGKVDLEAEMVKVNNIWRKLENGKIDYTYRGIGKNAFGSWYFENGVINFDFTDTYDDGEKTYVIEAGKVCESFVSNMTGMLKVNNTIWRMLENGKINYTYKGIGTNDFGSWYFENGVIKSNYTGTYRDEAGNTWVITEGKVETEVELAKVNNIWRKLDNGKIDYTYRGIGKNAYGTWYFENGEINFGFTDTYDDGEKAYIVEAGKVCETFKSNMTGMLKVNNTTWRMLEKGKINYTYTGIGTNAFGSWYFENGEINLKFTGTYTDYTDGKVYIIENGKVEHVITGGTAKKVTKVTAKPMENLNEYYCEDNNIVGTVVATNIDGTDLTSRVTDLTCDVKGSYEQVGITDANSGVTVDVKLNKSTGKYEIILNTSYPGAYIITPKATGDVVDASLARESITVRVEDKTTVNKIKLIDKATGKELENNTLELYSNRNNNYGIKVEFYHSYKNIERDDVLLSRTAEEITFGKPGEPFKVALCDVYQTPATGGNKVETLYVEVAEISEEIEGKITIKVEDGEAELTVKAKPVKTQRLKVNNDVLDVVLPTTAGQILEIPIALLDEFGDPKTISSSMIVKNQSQSKTGNIAIYIKSNPATTAAYLKMTYKYDDNGNITSIVFELSSDAARNNATTIFGQGIVFEFDTPTGRDSKTLNFTNLK